MVRDNGMHRMDLSGLALAGLPTAAAADVTWYDPHWKNGWAVKRPYTYLQLAVT